MTSLSETADHEYMAIVADLLEHPGIQNLKNYIQHGTTTTFQHVCSVSYHSYRICKRLNLDYRAAARAGILHDYVTYDWHDPGDGSHRLHGFRHPKFAAENAKQITNLSHKEELIIRRHMWPLTPLPPTSREGWVLTLVDKHMAIREVIDK